MDKSNSGDKVVRVIRVYESGRVRASRATAHAVPAEVTDKPKDPKKVAAGKARAAKAAALKAAGVKPVDVLPTAAQAYRAAKKKAAPKRAAKAGPKKTLKRPAKARKPAKPSPLPSVTKAKAPRADGRSKNAMVVVAFRVTPAQAKKLHRLGNGEFMRDRIDRAPEPTK